MSKSFCCHTSELYKNRHMAIKRFAQQQVSLYKLFSKGIKNQSWVVNSLAAETWSQHKYHHLNICSSLQNFSMSTLYCVSSASSAKEIIASPFQFSLLWEDIDTRAKHAPSCIGGNPNFFTWWNKFKFNHCHLFSRKWTKSCKIVVTWSIPSLDSTNTILWKSYFNEPIS